MDESRLTELESSVAFQDRTIQDLSDVVCRQQQEIDALKAEYKKLMERLENTEHSGGGEAEPEDETPPHY